MTFATKGQSNQAFAEPKRPVTWVPFEGYYESQSAALAAKAAAAAKAKADAAKPKPDKCKPADETCKPDGGNPGDRSGGSSP